MHGSIIRLWASILLLSVTDTKTANCFPTDPALEIFFTTYVKYIWNLEDTT